MNKNEWHNRGMIKRSRSTSILIGLTLLLTFNSLQAFGVENGESAETSEFVVPISIQSTSTIWNTCSGAVVAPTVVATAGHCVLDATGMLSSRILVGEPGSTNIPTTSWNKVVKIFLDDDYKGNTAEGKIANSDIAFLLLEKPFKINKKINLASENELLTLKSSGAKLRIYGYGYISDAGARSSTPKYFDSTFSKTQVPDPNQALAISNQGNICQGDSGGPVLSITPSKVILVGVITGAYPSVYCTKKQQDGTFLAAFSVINRFSNLATAAITESLQIEQTQNAQSRNQQSDYEVLSSQVESLQEEVASLSDELERTKEQLVKANLLLNAFSKSGLKAITCSNLVSTKIIVNKKPVCPKGFKKE